MDYYGDPFINSLLATQNFMIETRPPILRMSIGALRDSRVRKKAAKEPRICVGCAVKLAAPKASSH